MFHKEHKYTARLLCGAAAGALVMFANIAHAQDLPSIEIASQPLAKALGEFAAQTKRAVLVTPELTASRISHSVSGATDPEAALLVMLDGTGLTYRRDGDTFLIVRASGPQSGSAAGDGADAGTVQALVVTAQKREENIQDVPIAMSAFTQEDLTRSQVAGGPDLITQVPNMTFTKTNFTSYSIQIRGIGTQAISATTDAAVAVAFNNTPFIRNRFFEQEFYDLQRVEVLRGPQGTLYGRNATAGVVNIISAKPKFSYEAKLSGDVANYGSTRLEGMINLPLVEDVVALRLAGAWTKREGFVTNENTGKQTDGRDLWSTRVSLRFAPTDDINVDLIWEHFEENDDRLRSGKQLCHTDEITEVAGFPTTHFQTLPLSGQSSAALFAGVQGTFSQGCRAASLYSPDSFQVPSGLSLPYYGPLAFVGLPVALDDPYQSRSQSRDLRVIQSTIEPEYQADNNLVELQASIGLSDHLTLTSETAYSTDTVFSLQDFNRFNTAPGAWSTVDALGQPNGYRLAGVLDENGVYCDPQVGCADRLVAVDLSTAESRHFSQELRLSSDYEGPFNFSLGANFLRYDTEDKYYVFINSLGLYGAIPFNGDQYDPHGADQSGCLRRGAQPGDPTKAYPLSGCLYRDPNPIESLNDQGHTYFLSKNPYKLMSYAVFGEAYYNLTDNLKLTTGLRWTVDKKEAPRVPSWLLVPESVGYPVAEIIEQEWQEPTGRLALDWKPAISFTDSTLVYASYARGYKAGGANPPSYIPVYFANDTRIVGNSRLAASNTRPKTFDPEFVNAFELGTKNTLMDGKLTLNLASFYYDYTGYQISEIVDRAAFNHNYDATVWGLEVEADWRPLENLRLGFKGGYEKTRIADGEKAIDLMDRTAGRKDWVVVAPFPTYPSNCILPAFLFVATPPGTDDEQLVNLGNPAGGGNGGCELAYILGVDPVTKLAYKANPTQTIAGEEYQLEWRPDYPGWNPLDESQGHNGGEGFFKDLSGHELPNAPHFTATITGDYTLPLANDWLMTLHTDLYYQSEAWTRIFNTPGYDKLKAYTNVNLAAIFSNEDAGWRVMAYVKNAFDRDSITGAFLNSDDTGLTTNVFLTEPRLYGLRITKEWTGNSPFGGFGQRSVGPYPLTVELGGQVQRQDAPYAPIARDFLDSFSSALRPLDTQNRDLDWGDGRSLKLTYRPTGASWFLSADMRYGRTNGTDRARREEAVDAPECGAPEVLAERLCDPASPYYFPVIVSRNTTNWTDTEVRNREEHKVVDFAVGRDLGIGMFERNSLLSVGVRFAHLKSTTAITVDGIPNWYLPPSWGLLANYSTHNRYTTQQAASREFEGLGPVLSWDAASRLLGDDTLGRVDLTWAVSAGVLFGRQDTTVLGQEELGYWQGSYGGDGIRDMTPDTLEVTPVHIARSNRATVPVVDLSLGLAYRVDRINIGAGYRWERYFDAIDAGYTEHNGYDRTIDGPYFKISVGFGG